MTQPLDLNQASKDNWSIQYVSSWLDNGPGMGLEVTYLEWSTGVLLLNGQTISYEGRDYLLISERPKFGCKVKAPWCILKERVKNMNPAPVLNPTFDRVCIKCGAIVSGTKDYPCGLCGETKGTLLPLAYINLKKLYDEIQDDRHRTYYDPTTTEE